ncbi:hypothetical protein SDC9_94715 [bioreactor metagenome]|uniref:Uncharacterized protein n=1 Tax=bioreactor metagenome TaxID=1076179 RepID=A0A645AE97_9ZZZZ
MIDAGNRRHHRSSADRSGISRIRRTEIVDEQCFHTGYSVPIRQRLQIFLYGVIGFFGGDRQHSVLRLGRRINAIAVRKVNLECRIVGVVPAVLQLFPRQAALGVDTVTMAVERNVLQGFIIAQNNNKIVERILDVPLFIQLQRLLPIVLIGEVGICLFHAFLRKLCLDLIILQGQLTHLLEGLLFIVITIKVDSDKVKGIEQLATSGVGGMVAVNKYIVINHHTCAAISGNVIVASFH